MRRFLVRWVSNAVALWAAAALIGGVELRGGVAPVALAGLVFALVNTVVRPIVFVLALPAIVLTLGVALFFVNLLMLLVTDWLVGSFEIHGFWPAVLATVVVWLVNHAVSLVLRDVGPRTA